MREHCGWRRYHGALGDGGAQGGGREVVGSHHHWGLSPQEAVGGPHDENSAGTR